LRRVASGDGEAFAQLVERHQVRTGATLLRACCAIPTRRRTPRKEVFLRAYRAAWNRTEPRGAVFTWLYRIAVNHCLNRLRRRRLVRFLPLLSGGASGEEPKELDPPDLAPRSDRAGRVARDLAGDAGRDPCAAANQQAVAAAGEVRAAVLPRDRAGAGITEGAVESRLVRAMRTLQRAAEKARAQESNRSGVSSPGRG
jgi:RNA polymerase sigma-70 factor (ECF subfamily)